MERGYKLVVNTRCVKRALRGGDSFGEAGLECTRGATICIHRLMLMSEHLGSPDVRAQPVEMN